MRNGSPSKFYIEYLLDANKKSYDDLDIAEAARLSGLLMLDMQQYERLDFFAESDGIYNFLDDLINYLISFDYQPSLESWKNHHKNCAEQLLESISSCVMKASRRKITDIFMKIEELKFNDHYDSLSDSQRLRYSPEIVNGTDWRR